MACICSIVVEVLILTLAFISQQFLQIPEPILPSCCCQSLQPTLLPVELTVHCAIHTLHITHFSFWFELDNFITHIYYLLTTIHCHTIYNYTVVLE